jgi:hypothetical protein
MLVVPLDALSQRMALAMLLALMMAAAFERRWVAMQGAHANGQCALNRGTVAVTGG